MHVKSKVNVGLVTCWYRGIAKASYSYNLRFALEKFPFVNVRVVSSKCECELDKFAGCTDNLIDDNVVFVHFPPFFNARPKGKIGWVFYDVTQVFLHGLRGLAYLSKCKGCDVVQYEQSVFSFGILPLIPVLFIPTASKKIVTAHSLDKMAGLKVLRAAYNHANKVIVHSNGMRDILVSLGVDLAKIEVIPHGVKIPALLGLERSEVTFFGAPIESKGAFVVFEALKLLKDRGEKVVVDFYGVYSSSEKEAADWRAGELGVSDCVVWHGRLSEEEFDKKMQQSMFTFAIYSAPVAGSSILTRAMGNGAPVIATNIGGLPEYTKNIVLVPPNDPHALADAISELKGNLDLRRRLSEGLRKDAIEISWEWVAEKTLQVYLNVLKS